MSKHSNGAAPRPRKASALSIRDIAARARVSIGTVDRVLHDRGQVSGTTEARVRRIVAELGYRPNIYARNLSLAKVFHFGVIMPKLFQDSGYWRIPARGVERAHRELEAYKVRIRYHHFDRYSAASFSRALACALTEKPDGLLVAPVLPIAAEGVLGEIPPGIPYVFFDTNVPGARCLSFIGQNPGGSGLLAAHLMQKIIPGGGCVAIVKVMPEDFHINERIRGFRSGFTGGGRIRTRFYEADSHRGEEELRRLARRIFRETPDLRGIFISNAWTHPFADALRSLGRRGRIVLIGYDLVAKNLLLLRDGAIDFLISQRPAMQGYEGVYSLYRHVVLQVPVEREIMVPLDILTKDNFTYYQD